MDWLDISLPIESGMPTFEGDPKVRLEGLDLGAGGAGPYELLCLPIRLVGSDGVPARAPLRPRQRARTA